MYFYFLESSIVIYFWQHCSLGEVGPGQSWNQWQAGLMSSRPYSHYAMGYQAQISRHHLPSTVESTATDV